MSKLYLVFMCPRCGMVRYAREKQKTAKCLKCSYRMIIDPFKIRILLKTARRDVAIATVQKHKIRHDEKC